MHSKSGVFTMHRGKVGGLIWSLGKCTSNYMNHQTTGSLSCVIRARYIGIDNNLRDVYCVLFKFKPSAISFHIVQCNKGSEL